MTTAADNAKISTERHKNKLKIGLLLDNYDVPAWSLKMINNIMESDFAEFALIVINDKPERLRNESIFPEAQSNNSSSISRLARKPLEQIYSKLIERTPHIPDAYKLENCENILQRIATIRIEGSASKPSNHFSEKDIAKIKSHDIDVFLGLTVDTQKEEILDIAECGIWLLRIGDHCANAGNLPGFRESMESHPVTETSLIMFRNDLKDGVVLYRSFSTTYSMSITDNRSNCMWKSLSFVTRRLRELHSIGADKFFERFSGDGLSFELSSDEFQKAPSNAELFKLVYRKLKEKAKLFYKNRFFVTQWILIIDFGTKLSLSLGDYKKIVPPKDRFWADPHMIYKEGKYYVYVEEYPFDTRVGRISLIIMDEDGNFQEPKVILDKPYHLSYPFVFEHENEYYMIPESMSNKTVELYKCVEFPDKWEFQMNLMENVSAADATLWYSDNKWWMFANVVENDGASARDELFLFYSNDLLSNDWKSHSLNPIVSDCRISRPAGKLFTEDGKLYRASQNSSYRYGYGLNILEVKTLNEDNYEEVLVASAKPGWDKSIVGMHTINHVNSLNIIDAECVRRKFL